MTDLPAFTDAVAGGMARERALFPERAGWTLADWWQYKQRLDGELELLDAEAELLDVARLQGRILAVCLAGRARFGEMT